MPDTTPPTTLPTFSTLHTYLLTFPAPLAPPPPHPHCLALTSRISSLALHPALEAALHILNADLASAHFLVRHMQGPPAFEGMLLHGILHRVEGDFANARAWYRDVCGSEVYGVVWPGSNEKGTTNEEHEDEANAFLRACERLANHAADGASENGQQEGHGDGDGVGGDVIDRKEGSIRGKTSRRSSREQLEHESRREIERVVEFCLCRFGDAAWGDATGCWTRPAEDVRKIGEQMVSDGTGWRQF
ncbi:MAG: hypothetical protein M1819_001143 [Sarea resinae]|nr:MAG: hypothetical protein M1819_001143 [Sarea resinae]